MGDKKKIVIVGATSVIAEQCARLWVQELPIDLTLIVRNVKKAERIVADLRVRSSQSEIYVVQTDFLDFVKIKEIAKSISEKGNIDTVLIAHGSLADQFLCQDNLQICREALEINGVSPALWAEVFAQYMEKANHGTIALISSVAGDRGRKSNYIYGAAKGLVTRYAQGLHHRFAGTNIKVVLIKPGPTDTPMTVSLKNQGVKLASVEEVAKQIVEGIAIGKRVIYTPRRWRLIMMVIQHIPTFIFNKINI